MSASTHAEARALPGFVPRYLESGGLVLSDDESAAIYAIGHDYYTRGDYGRAADLFRLLVLCRPRDGRAWFSLAACHEIAEDDERAVALYIVALSCKGCPDDLLRIHLGLARVLARMGHTADSATHAGFVQALLDDGAGDDGLRTEAIAALGALGFDETAVRSAGRRGS